MIMYTALTLSFAHNKRSVGALYTALTLSFTHNKRSVDDLYTALTLALTHNSNMFDKLFNFLTSQNIYDICKKWKIFYIFTVKKFDRLF